MREIRSFTRVRLRYSPARRSSKSSDRVKPTTNQAAWWKEFAASSIVQFHFTIDDAANSFHQAAWFVVGFTLSLDLLERRAGEYRKRTLVNDLISRIQIRHDEVHGGSVCQHAVLKR